MLRRNQQVPTTLPLHPPESSSKPAVGRCARCWSGYLYFDGAVRRRKPNLTDGHVVDLRCTSRSWTISPILESHVWYNGISGVVGLGVVVGVEFSPGLFLAQSRRTLV